jgi:hypothetical protein
MPAPPPPRAEIEAALPLSSAAAARAEAEAAAAAAARPSKEAADAEARVREASAPFATAAAFATHGAEIAEKEGSLLAVNKRLLALEAEAARLDAGGGRTVRDRARRAELTVELEATQKEL